MGLFTGSCSMEELQDRLTDVYRCLVSGSGSCPQQNAADVARAVLSGLRVHVSSLSSLSLSVVRRLASGAEESRFCREVLRELQDAALLPQLVLHFRSEDQIVAHLAARGAAAWVSYHLLKSGAVSPAWQKKCVEAFQSAPPSPDLDACLWSLTDVLKRLVKGARHGVLGDLLSALDCSLLALCSQFLPEGGSHEAQSGAVFAHSGQQVTSFCLLLDLLEVLSACGVCVQSQRLVHARGPALLAAVSHGSHCFVRRKAALLLKRAALQRLGEDLAVGGASSLGLKQCDTLALAHSVLAAAARGWLLSVQLTPAAFFGGSRQTSEGETQRADCVMLRALSLMVLGSIQLRTRTPEGAAVHASPEVCVHVDCLWDFLRRCSVQLAQLRHRCCWVSVLFGEQDDDLMEAAGALLAVFLHHKQERMKCGWSHSAVLASACSSGFNPHCLFILLLQSISFDHSILLDFLISSETCFLEYLVRYLKCLRDDWPGLRSACERGAASGKPSLQESLPAPAAAAGEARSGVDLRQSRLVDYDSSDGSDPEDMDVSEAQPGPSACESGRVSVDGNRLPASPPRQRRFLSLADSPCAAAAPPPGVATWARALLCLSELKQVVTRLHAKKLFPYNPSSLLKLLTQVENAWRQAVL